MPTSAPAPISIREQLEAAHANLQRELPAITRVAAALYDRQTDRLKTFVNSTEGGSPLTHYDVRLAEVPSLAALAESGRDRVIDDLRAYSGSSAPHNARIVEHFGSSYTRPLYEAGRLRGFLFFDATETGYFTPATVQRLGVYADFIALLLSSSLFPMRMLKSAVQVASRVTHRRDPETGAHLDRMTRYGRLVARGLADEAGLDDPFVEYLFLFAPLHDLGKVAVPDRVLLKPGRLDDDEFEVMKTHTVRGAEMIAEVLDDLGVDTLPYTDMLRNVVRHHHERWDGAGYPDGLSGDAIPIEARIVAVADVFDALTSERPYKRAWGFEETFAYLEEAAGSQLDPRCVRALRDAIDEVREIHDTFRDAPDAVRLREGYGRDL